MGFITLLCLVAQRKGMVIKMSSNTIQKNAVPFKLGLTIDEAAAYIGIGRNTLRKLVKHEKLPVLLVGKKNVIRTDILEQFLTINQGINLLDFEQVKTI